jgi:hypothetical protein
MKRKSSAKYSYVIRKVDGQKFIMIEDECQPGEAVRSVTNDIENVIEDIRDLEGIRKKIMDYKIIYKDSEGIWDGVDYYRKPYTDYLSASFVHLRESHWLKAAKKYIDKTTKDAN